MKPDGNCLFTAVLDQITHPADYTANMLHRQTAFYMAHYASVFFPLIQYDLQDNESYEGHLINIFDGNVWADDIVITAVSQMFNISITLLSPQFDEAIHVFHNVKEPDIVLIRNGGPFASDRYNTHFSSMKSKLAQSKKPGSSIPTDKLKYYVKSEYEHGCKVGHDKLIETEKQHALERLKSINKDINEMESNLDEKKKSLDIVERRKGV